MDFFTQALSYFQKGGVVMYPLLLCSVAAVMIAVERYIYYRTADSGSAFAEEFCDLLDRGEWDEAYSLAIKTKGEAAAFAVLTMDKGGEKLERIDAFAGSKAERALDRLEEYLNYLGVIIMLAPVLGLLGTITGMISSFNSIDLRVENPIAITAGVGEALITTVFGLCISTIAICIHTYFGQRLKKATVDLEEIANTLVEVICKRK
jgi:biopolymer transport protein ExbB